MSHATILISRLAAAGVTFPEHQPERVHYTCRGQEPRTWLARVVQWSRRKYIRTDIRWNSPLGRDGSYSSGNEVLLDCPVAELSRADCVVAFNTDRDRFDLCVTTLDGFARNRQLLLPGRALAWHWRDGRRVLPVGQTTLRRDPEHRHMGIVVGVEGGLLGVRYWDQSRGPSWVPSETVDLRRDLVRPAPNPLDQP